MSLRAGVAQIGVVPGDIAANLQKHEEYIAAARDQGVEVLVFPELSLTGYQLGRQVPALAMPAGDPRLLALAERCKGIRVVCGFVEEATPGEYYNAAAWLQDGKVTAVHRKLNLPTYGSLEEGKLYTPGTALNTQEIKTNWSALSLICADLWNPGLVYAGMLRKPEVLVAPINSAEGVVSDEFSNPQNWQANLTYMAMTYGTPVIMANRCDIELGARFWGGSQILGARGEVLARAGEDEVLLVADIERSTIAAARFDLPTLRDANPQLISQLIADM